MNRLTAPLSRIDQTIYFSTLSFKFDEFAQLQTKGRGTYFVTPSYVISCMRECWTKSEWAEDSAGNAWSLRCVCNDHQNCDEPTLSFVVHKEEQEDSPDPFSTKFTLILKDALGAAVCSKTFESSDISFNVSGFIERQRVLNNGNNILADGSLHMDLVIEPHIMETSLKSLDPQFRLANNLLRLLESGDMSDISFKLSEDCFCFAHRFVLHVNAPDMLEFFGEGVTSIPVENTTSEIFKHLMRYVYGSPPEHEYMLGNAFELMEAGNFWGVQGLKLAAETALVQSRSITLSNVVKYLLFADANECALLKECALAAIKARTRDVMLHESFLKLQESPALLTEVLHIVKPPLIEGGHDLNRMSVVELRKRLEEKGLDVDGSKGLLVKRLQDHDQ